MMLPGAWRCEAHRLWTTGDCPDCDDEQIADLEAYMRRDVVDGMCLNCGAVEVLVEQTGTRDLSSIGEHHAYPTGRGCELCA